MSEGRLTKRVSHDIVEHSPGLVKRGGSPIYLDDAEAKAIADAGDVDVRTVFRYYECQPMRRRMAERAKRGAMDLEARDAE